MCYEPCVLIILNCVLMKCYWHNIEVLLELKKYVTQWNHCNTFLDIKEHMCCVPIGDTVVTSRIETLIRCVTRRPSNRFINL